MMMKRWLAILFLFLCVSMHAQLVNVQFNLSDFIGDPQAVQYLTLTPIPSSPPGVGVYGSSILIPVANKRTTGANGTIIISNVVTGYPYLMQLYDQASPPNVIGSWTNFFATNLTGTVNAATNLGFYAGPVFGWVFATNNYTTVAPDTGIAFYTNNGVLSIANVAPLSNVVVTNLTGALGGILAQLANGALALTMTNVIGGGGGGGTVIAGTNIVVGSTNVGTNTYPLISVDAPVLTNNERISVGVATNWTVGGTNSAYMFATAFGQQTLAFDNGLIYDDGGGGLFTAALYGGSSDGLNGTAIGHFGAITQNGHHANSFNGGSWSDDGSGTISSANLKTVANGTVSGSNGLFTNVTMNSGTFTGNGLNITNIPPIGLQANGTTPSSANFYRGDGTWQAVSAGGGAQTPLTNNVDAAATNSITNLASIGFNALYGGIPNGATVSNAAIGIDLDYIRRASPTPYMWTLLYHWLGDGLNFSNCIYAATNYGSATASSFGWRGAAVPTLSFASQDPTSGLLAINTTLFPNGWGDISNAAVCCHSNGGTFGMYIVLSPNSDGSAGNNNWGQAYTNVGIGLIPYGTNWPAVLDTNAYTLMNNGVDFIEVNAGSYGNTIRTPTDMEQELYLITFVQDLRKYASLRTNVWGGSPVLVYGVGVGGNKPNVPNPIWHPWDAELCNIVYIGGFADDQFFTTELNLDFQKLNRFSQFNNGFFGRGCYGTTGSVTAGGSLASTNVYYFDATIDAIQAWDVETWGGWFQGSTQSNIVLNSDLMSIIQDPAGIPGHHVTNYDTLLNGWTNASGSVIQSSNQVWVRPLGGLFTSTYAVGCFDNYTNGITNTVTLQGLGIPTNLLFNVYDCFSHQVVQTVTGGGSFTLTVNATNASLYKFYISNAFSLPANAVTLHEANVTLASPFNIGESVGSVAVIGTSNSANQISGPTYIAYTSNNNFGVIVDCTNTGFNSAIQIEYTGDYRGGSLATLQNLEISPNGYGFLRMQDSNSIANIWTYTTAGFSNATSVTMASNLTVSGTITGNASALTNLPPSGIVSNAANQGAMVVQSNGVGIWSFNAGALTNLNGSSVSSGTVSASFLPAVSALSGTAAQAQISPSGYTVTNLIGSNAVMHALVADSPAGGTNSITIFSPNGPKNPLEFYASVGGSRTAHVDAGGGWTIDGTGAFTAGPTTGGFVGGYIGITNGAGTNTASSFQGNVNNFVQLLVGNQNNGNNASVDLVGQNDYGVADSSGSSFYVNVGMNSSMFTGYIGKSNWGYSYVQANSSNAPSTTNASYIVGAPQTNASLYLMGGTSNWAVMPWVSNSVIYGTGGTISIGAQETNTALTTKTVLWSDANHQVSSIANGTGVLTNDGSGNLSWVSVGGGSGGAFVGNNNGSGTNESWYGTPTNNANLTTNTAVNVTNTYAQATNVYGGAAGSGGTWTNAAALQIMQGTVVVTNQVMVNTNAVNTFTQNGVTYTGTLGDGGWFVTGKTNGVIAWSETNVFIWETNFTTADTSSHTWFTDNWLNTHGGMVIAVTDLTASCSTNAVASAQVMESAAQITGFCTSGGTPTAAKANGFLALSGGLTTLAASGGASGVLSSTVTAATSTNLMQWKIIAKVTYVGN